MFVIRIPGHVYMPYHRWIMAVMAIPCRQIYSLGCHSRHQPSPGQQFESLGPISLRSSQIKSRITSLRFKCNNNYPIRSQICICHDSWAVVTCAKLWPDWIIIVKVRSISIFTIYGLCVDKPFVKSVIDQSADGARERAMSAHTDMWWTAIRLPRNNTSSHGISQYL